MLGFGPPVGRQARRDWWRRQIERQKESRLSVVDFCRRLGVGTATFYAWKRLFREAESRSADPAKAAPFVPVSIVDPAPAAQLEIELGNQCVVRVKGTLDPKLVRIAIQAAGQLGNDARGTC